MTALIDADILVYRAIAVSTSEVDWDGDGDVPLHNIGAAKQIVDELVFSWTKMAKKKKHLLIFSDRTKTRASFRHNIHPFYKGNRGGEKPAMHDAIHDYLFDKYPSAFMKDFEGDDMMGIMATDDSKYVMVSIDKDMLTIPAKLVNPMDKKPHVHKISLRAANYNWMYQTICGDTVDNFKGAPGAGPKAAEAALAGITNFGELVNAAMGVFYKQAEKEQVRAKMIHPDNPGAEFLMNARCARILRYGDYDRKAHRVKLWHPEPAKEAWANPHFIEPTDRKEQHGS